MTNPDIREAGAFLPFKFDKLINITFDPYASSAAEKTSQVLGEANSDQSGEEERGDLIQFYNGVFVLKMKSFALRYATHDNRVRRSHSAASHAEQKTELSMNEIRALNLTNGFIM